MKPSKSVSYTHLDVYKRQNVDFLGFIFYEKSPRFHLNHLSFDELKSINHKGKVGVFVNESIEKIIEIAERCGLNYIQLHGDEDENFILSPVSYTHLDVYKRQVEK